MSPEECPETADEALLWLKDKVEKLSDQCPMYSRTFRTHRRSTHRVFQNGYLHLEGEQVKLSTASAKALCERTYEALKAYRDEVGQPALLTWRVEPELREEGDTRTLYVRLCFEKDMWADAQ
jgi:hypothetical protein